MCIYSYKFVCASAYISRTRRRAGSLKGFPGFAFSRRICAIAITCRIRAGHRVSATPISAIRVRLRSRFSTRTRFTFATRDHDSQHDSHSRSAITILNTIHIRDSRRPSHSPILAFSRSHPRNPHPPSRSRLRLRFYEGVREGTYERVREPKKHRSFYYRVFI
jgi:hypothetical protein